MTNSDFFIAPDVGVAIVAPGGYAPSVEALVRGVALLEKQGCRIHNYYEHGGKYQRFAATDGERIKQLHAAAENPDVQVVMALRGGYGMSRLLPELDLPMLANSGKLFVGHSDFTALQLAMLAHADTISFAGPMVCEDFTREDISSFTHDHFWQCLSGPSCKVVARTADNPVVKLAGTLWGGNLAMLAHLTGSPYMPNVQGGILFVEDVNEHPYRVERMLLQLLYAGILDKQQALLLGDFSRYALSDYDNGYDFNAMLAFLRAQLKIPVLSGLPFGHIRDKVTLPVGCQASLVSQKNGFELTMTGYPVLDPSVAK